MRKKVSAAVTYQQYTALLTTYLRPLWRKSLLLLLLLLLSAGLRLLNPHLVARFIDTAVAGGTLPVLTQLALIFLSSTVVIQISTVVEQYLGADVGMRATNQLRADLMLHCLQLDMPFHHQQTPGTLIERIDGDVSRLNAFFAQFAVELLGNALLTPGILVVLWMVDWRAGLALSLFVFFAIIIINQVRHLAVPALRAERESTATLYGFLEERLMGREDIRSNGATTYVMRRFYEHARDRAPKFVKARTLGIVTWNTANLLVVGGIVVALSVGIVLWQRGVISVGTVYLIYRYTELLDIPIQRIGLQLRVVQEASAALIRIRELFAIKPQLVDTGQMALPDGPLSLVVEQVSFHYDHQAVGSAPAEPVFALQDISLSLAPGSVLGLLGRTGSGKTTLTRLLLRLYDPTQGSIRIGEIALPDICMASVRQRVGLVSQEVQLFRASVRDNLTLFAPDISDERIYAAIKEIGLWEWYQTLPNGLDSVIVPDGLSAGQAQLLAFVRVFLKDPGLIILDEASSRLDPVSERLLRRAIERLLTGRTAIIIAHRLETLACTDQIMILEQGRCVEYGVRAQLANRPTSRFARLLKTGMEDVFA